MSFKKVTIGKCTLYLGDCMDVLPTLGSVDAVVADPPYGLDEPRGNLSVKNGHKRAYSNMQDTSESVREVYVPAIKKSLELSGGRGIITPGNKHAWEYPNPDVIGCFHQPATVGMCSWGRPTMQVLLYYGKDPHAGKTIQHTTYTVTEGPSDKNHPCSKPMRAWQWVVGRASREGETVLDPFMGSGTTGVACVKMNRSFIGIEIDHQYFEVACQRIRDAYAQPDMFYDLAEANDNNSKVAAA